MNILNRLYGVLCICVLTAPALAQESLPCVNRIFSLSVHVFLNDDENPMTTPTDFQDEIDVLNKAFAPICISFEACEYEEIDNRRYARLIKNADWEDIKTLHNNPHTINIYVFEFVKNPLRETGFADVSGITSLSNKGIGLYFINRLTTQMGGYFGLLDTNSGYSEKLVDRRNCTTAGDMVCDTPADPFEGELKDHYNINSCLFISKKKDANDTYYDPLVDNFMSPYYCAPLSFTNGQYKRMINFCNAAPVYW